MIFAAIYSGFSPCSFAISLFPHRFSKTLKSNEREDITSHAQAKSRHPHNYTLPHDISVRDRTGISLTKSTGALRTGPRISPF